jgi:hypothetical protein
MDIYIKIIGITNITVHREDPEWQDSHTSPRMQLDWKVSNDARRGCGIVRVITDKLYHNQTDHEMNAAPNPAEESTPGSAPVMPAPAEPHLLL